MPHTLLLADDSVTIQRVIELTFADEDVTVVAVSDGDQAIERLDAAPPDIVLADIGMPGKNGYEVAQYMRRTPKLSHIPVVLLTGAFEPVDQDLASAAACDGVLAKPFEPQLVIGRVKELLARAARPGAADIPAPARIDDAPVAPPAAAPSAGSIWSPEPAHPATPLVAPPNAEPPAGPPAHTDLNDYFDRLDAAFSTLSSNTPVPAAAPIDAIADAPPAPADNGIDWFSLQAPSGNSAPFDLPVSAPPPAGDVPVPYASPEPDFVFDLLEPAARSAPSRAPEIPAVEPAGEFAPIDVSEERFVRIEEPMPVEAPVPIEQPPAVEAPAAGEAAAPIDTPARVEVLARFEALAPVDVSAPVEAHAPVEVPVPAEVPTPSETVAPTAAAPLLEFPLRNPPPLPPLADAFAALLAAEQGEAITPSTGTWPATTPPAPAAPAVTDAVIEDIVRRVLERLPDTLVRQAVADVASTVAERLVREEIARIKASIK